MRTREFKMQLKILSTKGESGSAKLPVKFEEPVRKDLIARAVQSLQSNRRQPYGADYMAGKRGSVKLSRRRRKYKGAYGKGISRVPRKTLSRNGTQMHWVGAEAPGMVGGRRAHPPKVEKDWSLKINNKERRKAIRSAMSATVQKELVQLRGHKIPQNYPFVIDSSIEKLNKTNEVQETLEKLGFAEELQRTSNPKIRAGKGKNRGRPYEKKRGLLLVVGGVCELLKSAKNIEGVDVVEVKKVNVELLAPGTNAGRATLFTQNAITQLEKEKLFM